MIKNQYQINCHSQKVSEELLTKYAIAMSSFQSDIASYCETHSHEFELFLQEEKSKLMNEDKAV